MYQNSVFHFIFKTKLWIVLILYHYTSAWNFVTNFMYPYQWREDKLNSASFFIFPR